MNGEANLREKIICQASHWVEQIKGELYNSIAIYMEVPKIKQKDLVKVLGIGAGRISQIINLGAINFRLEENFQIALKIDQIPSFNFEDKEEFLEQETVPKPKLCHLKAIRRTPICGFRFFIPT